MSKFDDEKVCSQAFEALENGVLAGVTGGVDETAAGTKAEKDTSTDTVVSEKKPNRDKDNTYFPVLPPF